jgi:uncharacterized protein
MGHFRPFFLAFAALWLALGLVAGPALAEPTFPKLTGRVVDGANVIPDDVEARLTQKLEALETQSQRQLVVVTLVSLQDYPISDYGYQLGRAWGLGDKERNDGALLIVAPGERKMRIEVGYGLEGIVTDGLSGLIVQNVIRPKFKAGDLPGGIEAGVDTLITQLTLPEDEARKIAAQAQPQKAREGEGIGPLVFVLFFFIFFVFLPMIRRGRGGRHHSTGLGPVIVWEALNQMSGNRGGWSSGGGSDWGGGSSWGGGGGSFGGGGASGDW